MKISPEKSRCWNKKSKTALVKFDYDSDPRFRDSLANLGDSASIDLFRGLDDITSQQYDWDEFVTQFGWRPLSLTGQDTFPGGNEMHQFIVPGPSSQLYTVFGYTYEYVVVICAIARKG